MYVLVIIIQNRDIYFINALISLRTKMSQKPYKPNILVKRPYKCGACGHHFQTILDVAQHVTVTSCGYTMVSENTPLVKIPFKCE